jgi:hypothetical protein
MRLAFWLLVLSAAKSGVVSAEPMGRWYSGFGQGITEYGIKNDSAGSDYFYIAWAPDGATIDFTVGGKNPQPQSTVIVDRGADDFELPTDDHGRFTTGSHVASDNFRALWQSLRSGSLVRIRLSTGETTVFTLKRAAKILPAKRCKTAFEL